MSKRALIIIISCLAAIAIGLSFLLFFGKDSGHEGIIFQADFNSGIDGFTTDAYVSDEGVTFFSRETEGDNGYLKINNAQANDARFIKSVKLNKNTIYLLSADVKIDSVAFGSNGGANLSVYSLYAHGFPLIQEQCGWQNFQTYLKVDKTDNYDICLRLGYFSGDTVGVAYFDNVKLETVKAAPSNVTVATVGSADSGTMTVTQGVKYNENTYEDMRTISWIVAIAAVLIFVLVYKYIKKSSNPLETSDKNQVLKNVLILFGFALILRFVLALTYYECQIDVNLFKYWGNVGTRDLSKLYVNCDNCDYPPLYLYFLTLFSAVSGNNGTFYTLLVKLIPILSDIAIGYFIYLLAKKSGKSESISLFFASLWLFNPCVILDSACWGQVDAFLSLFVVLAAYFINEKKYFWSGLMFGLGVMLKPQMIIFAPALGSKFLYDFAVYIKNKQAKNAFIKMLLMISGIALGLIVPTLPFIGMGMAECTVLGKTISLPWIFSLFLGTVDHYAYATVNCYNFWFLLGKNWTPDSQKVMGVSINTIGMTAIVFVSLVCIFYFVYKFIKTKNTENKEESGIYITGALIYLFVSCFGPRMHERYFFPALALLMIAFVITDKKRLLVNYSVVSLFNFIAVHEIMLGLLCGTAIRNAGGNQVSSSDYLWPKLDFYRGFLSLGIVISSLMILAIVGTLLFGRKDKKK